METVPGDRAMGVVFEPASGVVFIERRVDAILKWGYWYPYHGPPLAPEDTLRITRALEAQKERDAVR